LSIPGRLHLSPCPSIPNQNENREEPRNGLLSADLLRAKFTTIGERYEILAPETPCSNRSTRGYVPPKKAAAKMAAPRKVAAKAAPKATPKKATAIRKSVMEKPVAKKELSTPKFKTAVKTTVLKRAVLKKAMRKTAHKPSKVANG
jgi:hypothetical protein